MCPFNQIENVGIGGGSLMMSKYEQATELIGKLGFPIMVSCAMGWFIFQTQNQINESYRQREATLLQQIDDFEEALDALNDTMIMIDDRLDRLESVYGVMD